MYACRARAEREVNVGNGYGVRLDAAEGRGCDETVHGSVIWHIRQCGRGPVADLRAHTRVDYGLDDGGSGFGTGDRGRDGKTGQNGGPWRLLERWLRPAGARSIPGPPAKGLGSQGD